MKVNDCCASLAFLEDQPRGVLIFPVLKDSAECSSGEYKQVKLSETHPCLNGIENGTGTDNTGTGIRSGSTVKEHKKEQIKQVCTNKSPKRFSFMLKMPTCNTYGNFAVLQTLLIRAFERSFTATRENRSINLCFESSDITETLDWLHGVLQQCKDYRAQEGAAGEQLKQCINTGGGTPAVCLDDPHVKHRAVCSFTSLNFRLMRVLYFFEMHSCLHQHRCTIKTAEQENQMVVEVEGDSYSINDCIKRIKELYYTCLIIKDIKKKGKRRDEIKNIKEEIKEETRNLKENSNLKEETKENRDVKENNHLKENSNIKENSNLKEETKASFYSEFSLLTGGLSSFISISDQTDTLVLCTSAAAITREEIRENKEKRRENNTWNILKDFEASISFEVNQETGEFICGKKLGKLFKLNSPCLKAFLFTSKKGKTLKTSEETNKMLSTGWNKAGVFIEKNGSLDGFKTSRTDLSNTSNRIDLSNTSNRMDLNNTSNRMDLSNRTLSNTAISNTAISNTAISNTNISNNLLSNKTLLSKPFSFQSDTLLLQSHQKEPVKKSGADKKACDFFELCSEHDHWLCCAQKGEPFYTFEMKGSLADSLACYLSLLNEFPADLTFFIDSRHHKKIIGAGGFAIQKVMKKYNVYVKFFNDAEKHGIRGNVLIKTPMKNRNQMEEAKIELMKITGAAEATKCRECPKKAKTFNEIEELLRINSIKLN